ncbi:MAG: hypothetical protein ACI8UP_000665 [Porticoccaceae bacterium]|jgi:hypothetical protein
MGGNEVDVFGKLRILQPDIPGFGNGYWNSP